MRDILLFALIANGTILEPLVNELNSVYFYGLSLKTLWTNVVYHVYNSLPLDRALNGLIPFIPSVTQLSLYIIIIIIIISL
jgi:hypothetical protein